MDENLLVVADRLVAFSRVLPTAVVEEAGANRLSNLRVVLELERAAGDHWKAESIHDRNQLLSDILCALHCPRLDEVFVAPLVLESVHFPRLVHRKHGQMISVLVVKLSALLISELLLLTRSIEDILNREHRDNSRDLL